ncbi:MAG: acyltransferase [Thermoplasmata archaeon]|nr:acyltransferase [Thermoplasmata archaeon]
MQPLISPIHYRITVRDIVAPSRLKTADVLKGILILGVVFVHMFMLNQVDDAGRSVSLILQPLYMGLICFFVVAGYFLPSGGYIQKIKKRSKLLIVLVVCSVAFPVILYLWLWVLGQPSTLDDLWLSIVSSFGNQSLFEPLDSPDPIKVCYSAYAYYFLWVMLWSFFIFYAIVNRVLADRRLFAVTLLLLLAAEAVLVYIGVKLPFDSTLIPISVAFMLIGAYLSQMRFLEKLENAELGSSRTWVPLILSLLALAVLVYLFPPGVKFNFAYFGEYGGMSAFPFFIEGILVFIIFSYVSMLFARIPLLSDVFAICGKYSLALAVLHIFVVMVVLALFYTLPTDMVFPPLSAVQTLAMGVFAVVFTVGACMLVDRRKANRKDGAPTA